MIAYLLVAAGGASGALARWALGTALPSSALPSSVLPGAALPGAVTLGVNVSGCFLIGMLVPLVDGRPRWRLFLGTGVLGGYTTFSTYAVDAQRLAAAGRFGAFLWYAGATLLGALAATWLGTVVARRIIGSRRA